MPLSNDLISSDAATEQFTLADNSAYFQGYWISESQSIVVSSTAREDVLYATHNMKKSLAKSFQAGLDASECEELKK